MSDSAPRARREPAGIADDVHVRLFYLDALTLPADRWNARDVRSPYWRLYHNEDAGAYLEMPDGARYPFAAGPVYLIPAGVRFSCGNAGAAFRHFYIHFDVLSLPSLTLRRLFGGPVKLARDAAFEGQIAAFAESLRGLPRPQGRPMLELPHQLRAKALAGEALARSLEEIGAAAGLHRAAELEPVAPALEYIEAHLGERLRTADLAALCCLSEDHFARRFRDCVGQTPGAYLTERRVTRAAQRLLFTTASLDAIAEACGFGSRHYLTRVFTRATGVPPAAYRKSARP